MGIVGSCIILLLCLPFFILNKKFKNIILFLGIGEFLKDRPYLYLFLSGFLGAFGFPPVSFPLFWFFSLSFLLSFLWKYFQHLEKRFSQPWAFFLPTCKKTWFWFFGFYLGTLHWIANSLWTDPWVYGWFYLPVVLLLPSILSFLSSFFCGFSLVVLKYLHRYMVYKFLQKTQGEGVFFLERWSLFLLHLFFPFIFSFFYWSQEYIKGHGFFSFPWNLTAYIWSSHLPFAQGAYFLGSYGLGAVTLIILSFFWLSWSFFLQDYGQPFLLNLKAFVRKKKQSLIYCFKK